jgi:hypothetical protein
MAELWRLSCNDSSAMLSFLMAYLAASLVATLLYIGLAHHQDIPPERDAEAAWWAGFVRASERLGRRPRHAEIQRELREAA